MAAAAATAAAVEAAANVPVSGENAEPGRGMPGDSRPTGEGAITHMGSTAEAYTTGADVAFSKLKLSGTLNEGTAAGLPIDAGQHERDGDEAPEELPVGWDPGLLTTSAEKQTPSARDLHL